MKLTEQQACKDKLCPACIHLRPNYKLGFELLMSYWDSLPDEDKDELHLKLKSYGL